MSLWRQSL